MKLRTRRVAVASLAAAIAVVLGTGTAFAFWTATSSGSGNSNTDTLAAPVQAAPTSVTSTSAQINWTAVTTGWQKDAVYTATVGAGSQTCNAAASAGSCSLGGLVAGTTYTVTLTATFSTWTSAASNTKTVTPVASDTTAPSSIITFPATAASYNAASWTAGCTAASGVCGTSADDVGGSGVKSVAVSVQATSGANSGKYWSATAPIGFTSAAEVKMAATYAAGNWNLAFPASNLTDATYSVRAYATDNANNTQATATSASFTYDNTTPSGAMTAPANNATNLSGAQTVTATATDTGGSGVASVQFQYKPVAASSYTNIGSAITTGTSPYSTSWTIQGLPNGSYNLQAVITDKAGNTTTTTAITVSITQAATVTPSTADVGGGQPSTGRLAAGDKVVLNFPANHQPTFSTVCSTWTAATQPSITNATVTFTDGVGTASDTLSSVTSSTCTLSLGTFDLGSSSYLQDGTGNGTLVFTNSTIVWSGSTKTLTIALGTASAGGSTTQTVTSSVVTWTPPSSMQDANTSSFDYAVGSSASVRQF
jgi:hypothetical protein